MKRSRKSIQSRSVMSRENERRTALGIALIAFALTLGAPAEAATVRHKDVHEVTLDTGFLLNPFGDPFVEQLTYNIESRAEILGCPPEDPKHPIEEKCGFQTSSIFSLSRPTSVLLDAIPYIVPGAPSSAGALAVGTDLRTKNFVYSITADPHLASGI